MDLTPCQLHMVISGLMIKEKKQGVKKIIRINAIPDLLTPLPHEKTWGGGGGEGGYIGNKDK